MPSESSPKFHVGFVIVTFGVGIFTVIGLALLLGGVGPFGKISNTPEARTGVLIVLAVSIMALLLFTVSAGFRALGLSTKDEALGLPSGSVRAFIALMLIMIFAVLSVYAVRLVGEGLYNYAGLMTLGEAEALALARSEGFMIEKVSQDDARTVALKEGFVIEEGDLGNLFRVWQIRPISDGGDRLAQQLVTTVATLVVAVAGFYFGASNVRESLQQHSKVSAPPLIRTITPGEGKLGDLVPATLTGRNLSTLKAVRLAQDKKGIEATDVHSNDTSIQCKFNLSQPAEYLGKWDVVVENVNGEEDRLVGAFTILPSPPSAS